MKKSLYSVTLALWGVSTLGLAKDVATINGKGLTEEQYKSALAQLGPQADMVKGNPEVRKQFLDHIIEATLLANEAKSQNVEDSENFKS